MAIGGRAQSAANVTRRLNAAVKSRRLYAAGHQLRAQTINVFLATVGPFHERYGTFVLETHRDGLILEGHPFEGGESIDSLALQLYSLGVWQLLMLPGLTEPELNQLLDIVTMEPEAILREGGVRGLLVKYGIEHVRVLELRPGDEDPANVTLETYHRLLSGSLTAQERAALVGALRAGPEQAAGVLSIIIERTKQAFADASGPGLGTRVYGALTALDRVIVDAPAADSQGLLKNLADAVTRVDDPQRTMIHRTLLQRAAQDLSARALLTAMTSEQIARMVIPCLEEGESPPQLSQVVSGLPFDPQKARDVLTLVSQQTGRAFDLPPAAEELRLPPWVKNIPQDLVDFVISEEAVALSEHEVQALKAEAVVDETALLHEHALMLLHLILADEDPQEVADTLTALAADIGTLLGRGTYDLLGKIFQHLEQAARTDDRKAEAIRNTLRKILVDLANVMTPRDVGSWPEDHPLVLSLRRAGHTAGMDLAQALSVERDTARRATLVALLARIGEGALDAILPLLSHRNPELARAILPALVQMRSASAMTALRTLVRHPDARLRKEAVVALGPAPGTDAQLTLLAFVFDRDPQVVESCVRHLRVETARAATMQLIAALSARTLAAHPFLRIRIIELLVQAKATDALPVLQRLASPFKLRRRDREVARYARSAIRMLEQAAAAPAQRYSSP